MKKVCLALAVIAMFASCESGKTNESAISANIVDTDDETRPVMVFEKEVHEFGEISQGEKVSYKFKFTNEGKTDLIITSARGSCGCTVPEWPKQPIKPGESNEVNVIFDSTHKRGKQHKKVTVVANTMPSTNVIAFKGTVIAPSEPETEN